MQWKNWKSLELVTYGQDNESKIIYVGLEGLTAVSVTLKDPKKFQYVVSFTLITDSLVWLQLKPDSSWRTITDYYEKLIKIFSLTADIMLDMIFFPEKIKKMPDTESSHWFVNWTLFFLIIRKQYQTFENSHEAGIVFPVFS